MNDKQKTNGQDNVNYYKVRRSVFVAGFVVVFMCAAMSAFSVYAEDFVSITGASRSSVNLTLTIYQLVMAISGIFAGRIVDKKGARGLTLVGGLFYGIGLIIATYSHSLWQLYLGIGVIAGIGNGMQYNPVLNTALRWFPDKRGTISGLLLTAASLGPFLVTFAGTTFGLKGLAYVGILYIILSIICSFFMKKKPEDWLPEGYVPIVDKDDTEIAYKPNEMLKTGRFWLYILIFGIGASAGLMMISSLSSIAQTQLQKSAAFGASMVNVNSVANLAGRLIAGKACDKFGEKKTLAAILLINMLSLIALAYAYSTVGFIIALIFLGASFGAVLVAFPPLTTKTFGEKYSGSNYSLMFFGYALGSLIGPQLSSTFANYDAGIKTYKPSLIIASILALVGFILVLLVIFKDRTKEEVK